MPRIRKLLGEYPHIWWSLFLPVYLLTFFTMEHFITADYWATQLPIDGMIPFCEYFIVPYVLWSPLLALMGIYLILRDGEGFRRYIWTLALTFFTSALICVLLPNGQDLRPAVMERENAFTWLVQFTYGIDTNTNVLPSVHVVGVMCALFALWHTPGLRKWYWRLGGTAMGILVIISTLFVKQHAVLDIFAGLLLSGVAYVIIYIWIGGKRDRKIKEVGEHGEVENTDI